MRNYRQWSEPIRIREMLQVDVLRRLMAMDQVAMTTWAALATEMALVVRAGRHLTWLCQNLQSG
jgi:hypothetical protein